MGDGAAPIQGSPFFFCSWYWSVHVSMWVKSVQLYVQLCVHCVCKSVHGRCIHQGVHTNSFTHSCGVHTYVHLFRCLTASVHVHAHACMYQCVQEFKDSAIHRSFIFPTSRHLPRNADRSEPSALRGLTHGLGQSG